uniref:hypothetical protein n=1 Tax=Cupriavidus sp. 2SB TaxID=2502199 RepID=UPI001BB108BB
AAGLAVTPAEAIRAPLHDLWARYREPPTPAPAPVPAVRPRPAAAPRPTVPAPLTPAIVAALHARLCAFLSDSGDTACRDERLALLWALLGPNASGSDAERVAACADDADGSRPLYP